MVVDMYSTTPQTKYLAIQPWRLIYATALDTMPLLVEKVPRTALQNPRFLPPFHSYIDSVSNVETIWLWFVVGNS
jgi:hypothetical protein